MTSARLIAETPAAVHHAQNSPRFSVPPRNDGWRDILMEDSFVFRSPEPANEGGPGLAPDAPTLPFQRKTTVQGRMSDSALSLSLAAAGASDHVSILSDQVAMPHWDGMSVTVRRYGNGRNNGSLEGPAVYRDLMEVTVASDNRIYGRSQVFTGHNVYARPYLIGADVHVYRVTEGVLALARHSTVTGGAIDAWVAVSNRRAKPAAAKDKKKKKEPGEARSTRVDATTYEYVFASYNRPGVPYWFTVAAVDSNGNIGPKAAPVAFAPAKTEGTDKARNKVDPPNRVSSVAAFTDQPAELRCAVRPKGLSVSLGSQRGAARLGRGFRRCRVHRLPLLRRSLRPKSSISLIWKLSPDLCPCSPAI